MTQFIKKHVKSLSALAAFFSAITFVSVQALTSNIINQLPSDIKAKTAVKGFPENVPSGGYAHFDFTGSGEVIYQSTDPNEKKYGTVNSCVVQYGDDADMTDPVQVFCTNPQNWCCEINGRNIVLKFGS